MIDLATALEHEAESAPEERVAKLRRLAAEVRALEAAKREAQVAERMRDALWIWAIALDLLRVRPGSAVCREAMKFAMRWTAEARAAWDRVEEATRQAKRASSASAQARAKSSSEEKKSVDEQEVWMVYRSRAACTERSCTCCGYFYGPKHKRAGERAVFVQARAA